MALEIPEGLELSYDNSGTASFLVIMAAGSCALSLYQYRMLAQNEIRHIIKPELRQCDGRTLFHYNITSRLALSAFLKRRKLSGQEFTRILSDVSRAAARCEGYLLAPVCFLLRPENVYIHPVTLELELVYVPAECKGDFTVQFRDFVIDLILHHVELEEGSSGNLLQKMLEFVKNELFRVPDFYLFLERLNCRVQGGDDFDKSKMAADKADHCSDNTVVSSGGAPCEGGGNASETQYGNTGSNKTLFAVVGAIAAQPAVATGFLLFRGYLAQAGNDGATTFAALIVVAGALDLLILKYLYTRVYSDRKQMTVPGAPGKDPASLTLKPEDVPGAGEALLAGEVYKNLPSVEVFPAAAANAAAGCNTVLLVPGKREKPSLIGKYSGPAEEIILDKPEFIIGRLEGQVDHVSANKAVGKVHASIAVKDGRYFVTDMNSVNGTYINGIRIDSNREVELHQNDAVSFANSEYVFILPE